jgi:hypothetical protein
MATLCSLSTFPAASTGFVEPMAQADSAEDLKRWAWMVRRWLVTVDTSFDGTSPEEGPFLNPVPLSFSFYVDAGANNAFPPYENEKHVLNYRGAYAGGTETYPPDFGITYSIYLGERLAWGPIRDNQNRIITENAGFGYSVEFYCDVTTDGFGGTISTTESEEVASGIGLIFDNASSAKPIILYGSDRFINGTVSIQPYQYWEYVPD